MRIAIVGRNLSHGDNAHWTVCLANSLKAIGHKVFVHCLYSSTGAARGRLNPNIELIEGDCEERFNLVLVNDCPEGLLFARHRSSNLVGIIRDSYLKHISKWAVISKFVVPTPFIASFVEERLKSRAKLIVTVPPFVNCDFHKPRLDLPADDTQTVGYYGEFAHHKMLHFLMRIFASAYQSNPKLRLRIIGGPDRNSTDRIANDVAEDIVADLEATAELYNIESVVELVPHAMGIMKHQAIDLFCYTSHYESMPIDMLNALASGRPVIAPNTGNGGVAAVLNDLQCPVIQQKFCHDFCPQEIGYYAATINSLLADSRKRDWIREHAPAYIREHYSVERFRSSVADWIDELMQ